MKRRKSINAVGLITMLALIFSPLLAFAATDVTVRGKSWGRVLDLIGYFISAIPSYIVYPVIIFFVFAALAVIFLQVTKGKNEEDGGKKNG